MRTYWLSFVDADRPPGQRFLGVVILDVTEAEAAAAKADIDARFPQHQDGAEWIAAAAQKAWHLDCNPGGEVAATPLDPAGMDLPTVPRNRLLSHVELVALGLVQP